MRDWSHIPTDTGATDVQIFTRPSTVTNTQWMTWQKPRGKAMMHILCIGGGAGGGGGGGSADDGGGGGGASGLSRVTIPLVLVPDRLYVQVAAGGAGGAGGAGNGSAGSSGGLSYVNIMDKFEGSNTIARSGSSVATGGGGGNGAGGTAGAGSTISTLGQCPLAGLGQVSFIAGQAGTVGGTGGGADAGAQTIPVTGTLCMGGTGGGGGGDTLGGAITAIADSFLSENRPVATTTVSNGHLLWKPFFSFPGLGGAKNFADPGVEGGNGALGSGGGGGAHDGGGSGKNGGAGGDGIVFIISW